MSSRLSFELARPCYKIGFSVLRTIFVKVFEKRNKKAKRIAEVLEKWSVKSRKENTFFLSNFNISQVINYY